MSQPAGQKQAPSSYSEKERYRVEEMARELFPRILPPGWARENDFTNAAWFRSDFGLVVLCEVELVAGEAWLHVSYSRRDEISSYRDTATVKRMFVGSARKAVMVLPAEEEHVNIHPFCLHLYSPLDRDPLPDFRMNGGV